MSEDGGNIKFVPVSLHEKIIRDYTGFSFAEIENLNFIEYYLYLRDGHIYKLNQTEEGRDYLERCWVSQQTQPDRTALRQLFGGG